MMIDTINQRLLNDYQHTFPLVPKPFDDLARKLNTDVNSLLKRVHALKQNGTISRIGPVFKPNTIGVSTLAAISVPADELDHYAEIINRFPEINHNYEREHEINLWFVLTAGNQHQLDTTITEIEIQTGQEVLVLPLLKEYHIDLGFNLRHLNQIQSFNHQALLQNRQARETFKPKELAPARDLIEAIQGGLPLVERPYQALAEQLELCEAEVIEKLKQLISSGAIKRFGVVVRHHEVGYLANAMVVWDVSDSHVDQIGQQLGKLDCVTLCYQRPRVQPRWPYNLFCMIHGQNREEVLSCIAQLRAQQGLESVSYNILFSGKRFKQRGAHYRRPSENKFKEAH